MLQLIVLYPNLRSFKSFSTTYDGIKISDRNLASLERSERRIAAIDPLILDSKIVDDPSSGVKKNQDRMSHCCGTYIPPSLPLQVRN